jgi:transcriptional regulator with XRE-family HTH domain
VRSGGATKTALKLDALMPSKVLPSSEFGRRLTAIRQERGLTQTQLAELINATQRVISYYETVADSAPGPIVAQLAQVLEVSADELLGLRPPKKARQLSEDPKTKRLWKKFQLVQELPEKDQRAVIRLVNSLVSAQRGRRANGTAARQ